MHHDLLYLGLVGRLLLEETQGSHARTHPEVEI